MPWGCCPSGQVKPEPKAILGDDLVLRSSNTELLVPLVSVPEYLEAVCRHFGPKTSFVSAAAAERTAHGSAYDTHRIFWTFRNSHPDEQTTKGAVAETVAGIQLF